MDSRPSPRMTKEQLRRQRIKSTAFSTIQGYIASIFWQCTSHDSAPRRQIAHPGRVNVISGETAGLIRRSAEGATAPETLRQTDRYHR